MAQTAFLEAIFIYKAIFWKLFDKDKFLSLSNKYNWHYATGLTVGNRSTELECCQTLVSNYCINVSSHSRYFSTVLESLQTWNCPQFKQEC